MCRFLNDTQNQPQSQRCSIDKKDRTTGKNTTRINHLKTRPSLVSERVVSTLDRTAHSLRTMKSSTKTSWQICLESQPMHKTPALGKATQEHTLPIYTHARTDDLQHATQGSSTPPTNVQWSKDESSHLAGNPYSGCFLHQRHHSECSQTNCTKNPSTSPLTFSYSTPATTASVTLTLGIKA